VDVVRELAERHRADPRRVAFAVAVRLNRDARNMLFDAEDDEDDDKDVSRTEPCEQEGHEDKKQPASLTSGDSAIVGLDIDVVAVALSAYRKALHAVKASDSHNKTASQVYSILAAVSKAIDVCATDRQGTNRLGKVAEWHIGSAGIFPETRVYRSCASMNIACALLCKRTRPLRIGVHDMRTLIRKLSASEKVREGILIAAEQELLAANDQKDEVRTRRDGHDEVSGHDSSVPEPLWRGVVLEPIIEMAKFHERLFQLDDDVLKSLCENMALEGEAADEVTDARLAELSMLTHRPLLHDADDANSSVTLFADGCFMLRYAQRRLPPTARAAADRQIALPQSDAHVHVYP